MKTARFKIKYRQFVNTLKHEYRYIFTDPGVILIIIGAIFIYSLAYSFAYKNEVLENVPIAIIDYSDTPASRQLTRTLNSTPNINVAYEPVDMDEAKALFMERKINGIVVIPFDYEKKIMSNQQVNIAVYADASYFLMYRQVFFDVIKSVLHMGAEINWMRFVSSGVSSEQALVASNPVSATVNNMYNPYGGYATFIVPAIFMVIIQQTLLIGIGMVGGTWREQKLYKALCPPGEKRVAVMPIVIGRSVAYISIYCITMTYLLAFHYKIFGYPMNGDRWDIMQFLIPYLLSCTFLGLALSSLFKYRENSLLWMLFTSIPFLMLSGASIPQEIMPQWLYKIGKIIPSSSGVEGFLRLQTMGATLQEVSSHYITLWILTFVYLLLACLGMRRAIRKSSND